MKNFKYFRPFTYFLFIILYSCGEVPTAIPGQSFDHFVGDFETGTLDGFSFLVPDTSFNTKIVTSPVRKGTYALKNTLRPTDFVYNGIRVEMAVYNCAKYKTDVYYGFSLLIDTNYADDNFNLVCQWQNNPYYIQGEVWDSSPVLYGSPPPLALVYVDGNLQISRYPGPISQKTANIGSVANVSKGVWHDLVFHMYWSDQDDGF